MSPASVSATEMFATTVPESSSSFTRPVLAATRSIGVSLTFVTSIERSADVVPPLPSVTSTFKVNSVTSSKLISAPSATTTSPFSLTVKFSEPSPERAKVRASPSASVAAKVATTLPASVFSATDCSPSIVTTGASLRF